jgi:hypothetical protein
VWPSQNEQVLKYKNYLKKKVKVTGIVQLIKYGSKDPRCELSQIGCEREVMILIPEKIQEILEDETANWKIYKNEEYGFEIKYPEDWEIYQGPMAPKPVIAFEGVKYAGLFKIEIVEAPEEKELKDYLKEDYSKDLAA